MIVQNDKILFSLLELADISMSNKNTICTIGDFNYPSIKWKSILTHVRDFKFVEAICHAYLYLMVIREEMEEHKVNYFQGLVRTGKAQGLKTCAHSQV